MGTLAPAMASDNESETLFPSARIAWTAVVVLLLLYALAFVDRQIISLMVKPVRADLGISDLQIGLLQGFAFALLFSVVGLPLGLAVDRLARRRVIFVGVIVWAMAATACGLARTFPELLAARLFVGAGEAALAPAAYSMLSDLFPKRRLTFALSIYSLGALLGASLSLALGGWIIESAANGVDLPLLGHVAAWRFAFLATGLPGLALAFLIFLIPEPRRRRLGTAGSSSWTALIAFMRRRSLFFACHFIGFACMMALAYARLAWMPSYFAREFGWSTGKIGAVLALFYLVSGGIAMPLTGLLVDRMAARGVTDAHFRVYVWGGLICATFGVACWLMPTPTGFFAVALIASIPLNMAAVAASAVQIVTPAHFRGRVSAIYLLFCSLAAMTIGPGLVGLLTDKLFHDDRMINWSLAATSLVLGPLATVAFLIGLKPMRAAAAVDSL